MISFDFFEGEKTHWKEKPQLEENHIVGGK